MMSAPTNNLEPIPQGQRFRLLALGALTLALIALCVLLAIPFLEAITWGVALAIIGSPWHSWVKRHVSRPNLCALIGTSTVVVVILVPGLFVIYQVSKEANSVAEHLHQEQIEGTLRQRVAEVPVLRDALEWMDRMHIDPETEARKLFTSYTQDASSLLQGSLSAAMQFLIMVFILYHIFRDRSHLMEGLRGLLPLTHAESDQVIARAADSVHASLYATLVTSLIDAVGGGLMFWLLGLPAPFLWALVMFVLSILPIVGAGLVWFPAALYLMMTGQWFGGLVLVAWGVIDYIIVDTVLYFRLAGDRLRMHEAPMLISFLGGLAVFGLSGMILGPAILAVTMAILEVWKRRAADEELQAQTPAPGLAAAVAQPLPTCTDGAALLEV